LDVAPAGARMRAGRSTAADYDRHLAALKAKLEGAAFTVVRTPPFVVIATKRPTSSAPRADKTVRWAVTHLKQLYFTKDPGEILDIWLFRDKASYESNAQQLFSHQARHPLRLLLRRRQGAWS